MSEPVITESDYEHWIKHGYVVVRLLDDDKLKVGAGQRLRLFSELG